MTNPQHAAHANDAVQARASVPAHGARLTLRGGLRRFAQRAQLGWLLGIVALVPLGIGVLGCDHALIGAGCNNGDAGSGACVCEYDGKRYAASDSFPATDGCNHCSCQKDGNVACTLIGCGGDGGGGNNDGGGGATCGGLIGAGCAKADYCMFAPEAKCGAADQTGTCSSKPEVCSAIYAPVCGCDGTTYSSACNAAGQGVSVASEGECKGGQDAGAGLGCDYDGKHYAIGASFPATDGCNQCSCTKAGVACTEIGCNSGGKTCGGLIGGSCATGEYCDYPIDALCGAADATGTCETIPTACTKEYVPVCGCDDKTYGNACEAAANGVALARQGACDSDAGSAAGCDVGGMHYAIGETFPDSDGCNQCTCSANGAQCTLIGCDPGTGKTCGGIAGITCSDAKQFCDFAPATMCGSGDQSGTCKARPDACTDVVAAVCGCDGNNYSNACFAAVAGVAVRASGACLLL